MDKVFIRPYPNLLNKITELENVKLKFIYGEIITFKKQLLIISFVLIFGIVFTGVFNIFNSTNAESNFISSNYVTADAAYEEVLFWSQKQHGLHSCGPTSGAMALSALGIIVPHEHMTVHYKTTMTNTNPSDIISGSKRHAAEHGIKVEGWFENFNDRWQYLGELIANKNIAVILHGRTSGWTKYYSSNFGHYVFPVKIDLDLRKIWIADPDRPGILEYTFDEFKPGLDAINQPSLMILKRIGSFQKPSAAYYAYLNDVAAPRVIKTVPADNSMGYSRNGSIEIKFSENITAGTSYRNITVMNLATNKYVIIGKSISGNTLTLKTRIRSSNTWYQVKIPSKSVRDGPGKSLQNNYTFKFKTGTQLD